MKNFNFTLVLISFFFFSLFAEGSAQSKVKINHYVKVKAQSFPKNNWLLYELKDSTIVFLAYEQRRLFHKKQRRR